MNFTIHFINSKNELIKEIKGTTIGHKRILTFPSVEANEIKLSLNRQKGETRLAEIEVYLIDSSLAE